MEAHKKKRYDRQLRMWGEHGQMALEQCKLCVLTGSATGTEAVKNLVLPGASSSRVSRRSSRTALLTAGCACPPLPSPPDRAHAGIGAFTVVDGAVVQERDLGNNFFLDATQVGESRARCVTSFLQELNEHSRGSFVQEDPLSLLRTKPSFLDDFTFVIASQLPEPALRVVASACEERGIPLVALRSYGLCGSVRVITKEAVVVEAHPEHTVSDLRVCAPFPELLAFLNKRFPAMDTLSALDKKHIPYVVLLLRALAQYRASHGNKLPAAYKDKQEVKGLIAQLAEEWFGAEGAADAVNFEEAKAAVNTALSPPSIPSNTAAVLREAEAREAGEGGGIPRARPMLSGGARPAHPNASCAARPALPGAPPSGSRMVRRAEVPRRTFWIIAAALARFVREAGTLPLLGTIPDMTSDTDSYVSLVAVYRKRAAADATAVFAHASAIAHNLGYPDGAVTLDAVKRVCKNAPYLRWVRYRSYDEELHPSTARAQHLATLMDDAMDAPTAGFYLLLRAADAFHTQYNRWPGSMDNDLESDVPLLKQVLTGIVSELKPQPNGGLAVKDDMIYEFCRYGGAEIHSVAAIIGGVGAQEAIKLITEQFVPLSNTFFYNGWNGTCMATEL